MATVVNVDGKKLKLTHLDKVLYPDTGFTKAGVIDYYRRIAPVLLPHLKDRPVTLKRYPDGVEGEFFFEKNCPGHRPDWLRTRHGVNGPSDDSNNCMIDDLPALIWAVNLGAIELHPQLYTLRDTQRPTAMVFDFDPGPPANLRDSTEIALQVRKMLEGLGLRCLAKTSGGKGLHVYVPLNTPDVTFDQTKRFAKTVARLLEKHDPDRVISRMKIADRTGKVFIDWSQNDRHKTTAPPYILRARSQPTVATPLTWDEVEELRESGDIDRFTFLPDQTLERVQRNGDLFAPVLELEQTLPQ